jgi:hypothetical protein
MVEEIVHNLDPFPPGFLMAGAINKICFIPAALAPAVFCAVDPKRNCLR